MKCGGREGRFRLVSSQEEVENPIDGHSRLGMERGQWVPPREKFSSD
jgi:hypothetical protein